MDHLRVVERSHQVVESIDCSDVGQESITQTSTSRSAADEAGDVGDVEVGRDPGGGLPEVAEPLEALVRDRGSEEI